MRKSFGILRCDTQIYGDKADYFVMQVRQCLTSFFYLALSPSVLIGIEGCLVIAVLKEKTRNYMLCDLHFLGKDHGHAEELTVRIKTKISGTGLKVCMKGLEKFMGMGSQMGFRNYLHWEQQQWQYVREIAQGLFNKPTSFAILKEMYISIT